MVDIFSVPVVTDVGQFGADNNNVGRYKQAAEYAADAQTAAEMAKDAIAGTEALLETAKALQEQANAQEIDIAQLKADFASQKQELLNLKSSIDTAASDAQNVISTVNQKILEIDKALANLAKINVKVTTLPAGQTATGSFDSATGTIALGIPEGDKGADGSVTDLSTVTMGVPTADDIGFYVNHTDSIVHKAKMSDIAQTFPSVTSVKVGSGAKQQGDVVITKADLDLSAVRNIESYSKVETNDKYKASYKVYNTLAEATADAPNRENGEKVIVWKGESKISLPSAPSTTHDIYTVNTSSGTPVLNLVDSVNRIETINGKAPDDKGNVDVTIPTGNPSLYLGEMLMFPYDPDNEYDGAGLIPADGRLVNRVDQPLLFKELVDGRLPVVSETEWQSGKKAYYSWGGTQGGGAGGDGDATHGPQFRVPDWTDGTALRTPDVDTEGDGETAEYDGSFFDQIPYIATVNGVVPDESTGAVVLTAADIGAIATGGNAGSATKLATARKISGKDFDGTADITLAASDVGALASTTKAKDIEGADVDGAGVNTNIKKLTALEGTLTLGSSGISGNDAVGYNGMVSYVAANGGGGAGAKLNGIMTNFIGAVDWYLGTRTGVGTVGIPGYIAADGQTLNRADYPDLWAAIDAGLLATAATDAAWVAGVDQRGLYTKGNGTTTFRVPDLNGTLINGTGGFTGPSSLAQPFLRGNAGTRVPGTVQNSQVENHTHPVPTRWFTSTGDSDLTKVSAGSKSATDPGDVITNTYGNNSAAMETRPINVSGVWIIRAKGNFESANTNFNVIVSDAAKPATGTVHGGDLVSNYTAANKLQASATVRVAADMAASGKTSAELVITDGKGSSPDSKVWTFDNTGKISSPGTNLISANHVSVAPGKAFSYITATDLTTPIGMLNYVESANTVGVGNNTATLTLNSSTKVNATKSVSVTGKTDNTYAFVSDASNTVSNGPSGDNPPKDTFINRFATYYVAPTQRAEVDVFNTGADIQARTTVVNGNDFNVLYIPVGGACGDSKRGAFSYAGSDIALKDLEGDVDEDDAGERISKLTPREFTWKVDGRKDRGFIAQEAYEVDERYAYDADPYWGLSDRAILADVVKELQRLRKEVAELKASK